MKNKINWLLISWFPITFLIWLGIDSNWNKEFFEGTIIVVGVISTVMGLVRMVYDIIGD